MATLNLINTEKNGLLLKGDHTNHGELEYYSIDGEEGGKATKTSVTPWNQDEECLDIEREYDEDDSDSFWTAQQEILIEAKERGIELPNYAEIF